MRRKQKLLTICSALAMLTLILDSSTAIKGAQEGITLCLQSVIPSLFPFFVLSGILTSSLLGAKVRILQPIGTLLGIPQGGESVFLVGLIGGYPLGIRTIHQFHTAGSISAQDARRMAAFCSNAGPAFLFGMAGAVFQSRWIPWALWGIHILSAMATALVLPGGSRGSVRTVKASPLSPVSALRQSLTAMASVCGWVVLFRVVIAFAQRWFLWLLPTPAAVLVTGLMELSNGCCSLSQIPDEGLRMILCSAMLAFGGLCVAMQTVSVGEGLDLSLYLPGKLLQTGVSVVLSLWVVWLVPTFGKSTDMVWILLAGSGVTVCFSIILRKMQKCCSIPTPAVV